MQRVKLMRTGAFRNVRAGCVAACAAVFVVLAGAGGGSTGSMTPVTSMHAAAAPDFAPFAKDWVSHAFGLTVNASGAATAWWRVYTWCSENPTPPCDGMDGHEIIPGGRATVSFNRVEGDSAYGAVTGTIDPEALSGNVSLTLQEDGMALLEQSSSSSPPLLLCGPDVPESVMREAPCGA